MARLQDILEVNARHEPGITSREFRFGPWSYHRENQDSQWITYDSSIFHIFHKACKKIPNMDRRAD